MDLKTFTQKNADQDARAKKLVKNDLAFQVGREIERIRMMHGLTQSQLAKKIKTKQPSIARAEGGTFLPGLAFLKKIADSLGENLEVRFNVWSEVKSHAVSFNSNVKSNMAKAVMSPYQMRDLGYTSVRDSEISVR